MPFTYPPAPPTLDPASNLRTIHRFLDTPTYVQRMLVGLTEKRFIGEVLLSGRVSPSGGAIEFEQNESIYPDYDPEPVNPGAEFPITTIGEGPALVRAVRKWGLDTFITDESIRRRQRNPVDRALLKLRNGIIRQFDRNALAAINAAPVQTLAVGASWDMPDHPILREILVAKAMITSLEEGYEPNTLVVNDFTQVALMSNDPIREAMARERVENPVYTGQLPPLAGLDVMVSNNLPDPTAAYVLDRNQLGGIADEVPLTAGSIRDEERERWRLRVKRISVPFVQEPQACVKLVGVSALEDAA